MAELCAGGWKAISRGQRVTILGCLTGNWVRGKPGMLSSESDIQNPHQPCAKTVMWLLTEFLLAQGLSWGTSLCVLQITSPGHVSFCSLLEVIAACACSVARALSPPGATAHPQKLLHAQPGQAQTKNMLCS